MGTFTEEDATAVDRSLAELPRRLLQSQLTLKQKRGYLVGKLSASRNWCRIVDEDIHPRMCANNALGQLKTWKLLARFDNGRPPPWPWDKLEQCEGKRPTGMISGDDVWGVAYEDIRDWLKVSAGPLIVGRLAEDLRASFTYSRQRYC